MFYKLSCLMMVAILNVSAAPVQKYYLTKLDHYSESGDDKFQARYVIDDSYWLASAQDTSAARPILFYCGNEGDIWSFYENSGFITKTLAEKWGALVVFAEHRYFGQSMPFGKDSMKKGNNQFLTVDNTLMDYVELIKALKVKYGAEGKAVIAFGGSYGGMLAAWMRMKHPHVIQGALASSAPIFYFKGADQRDGNPETRFFDIITEDFAQTNPGNYTDGRCSHGIKEGFEILMYLRAYSHLWPEVNNIFKLCDDIKVPGDIDSLYEHISNAYAYMAMTDYPTAANFLNPMPAWPVNASCEFYANLSPNATPDAGNQTASNGLTQLTPRQIELLTALNNSANVYFNYANRADYCMDGKDTGSTGSLDGDGWNVLQCNQLAMPNSTGPNSMFLNYTFNYTLNTQKCQEQYGLTPNYDWALTEYGGYNITRDLYGYNNIIFSNGQLDPWRAGGVQGDQYFLINLDLPYYVIKGGAHHLDLREPTPEDKGTDVEWVREHEIIDLQSWILAYQAVTSGAPPSDSPMVNGSKPRSFSDLPAGFIQ